MDDEAVNEAEGAEAIDFARVAKHLAARAGSAELAAPLAALMAGGRAAFDPPLIRAALAGIAEPALSAALIRWPTDRTWELAALAKAQTLLAAGVRIGIAGAPSQAALDALDAAARLADFEGGAGPSILVRPEGDAAEPLLAEDAARTRASAALAAGARALNSALADLAIEAVRSGLDTARGGVQRKAAAARLIGAPDSDILSALAGAVTRGAYAAALDAGADPARRRVSVAAPNAGAHMLAAFAASDPTGAVTGDDERGLIAASIALPAFHAGEHGFDIEAFEEAVRVLVRALDGAHGESAAPRRAIVIRLEGLAALLLRAGFGYDSEDARLLGASVAALASAAASSESAALAEEKSAFPDWPRATC